MPKINVVNSDNVIECKPQKAFFKLTNTGGLKGDKGDKGDDATVSVGTTTTGAPGTNASVTNSGTSSAAVLDFTIPRGADGADGAAATVAVGTTTTLDAGSSATVTNSGTSSAAVLDFGIPKGADGQDGQDGAAATITVGSTTTGEPGTDASVTNSGSTSAAVLDFTIPRGATGATGQDGQDGADGFSPSATVTSSNNDATISITDKDGTTTATVKGFGFEEVSTLPASGSSEKLYLTPHTYPTNTATGSSISLNDSAAAPLKSVQIDGETIQTGKNIFDKNNVHAINAYVANQAINSATDTTIFVVCKPSTTYTITKTASTPQTANRFRVATTSVVPAVGVAVSDFINPGDGTADTSVTITTGSSAQYIVVTVQTSAATSSLSSIYSTLQIEEGSSSTPYEPYIGGVPNPNYPVPVQTVTGENVVQICGKNLWGGTLEVGGIRIETGNNDTSTDRVRTKGYVSVGANTAYTISGVAKSRFAIFYNKDKNYIGYVLVDSLQASGTFTTPQGTAYIRWYILNGGDTTIQEQLELGNQATAYQAYTGQSYEVNLGKNLYNPSTTTRTGDFNQNIRNELGIYPGEIYTFNVTDSRPFAAVRLYDSSGAQTRAFGNTVSSHTITFTVASNEVKAAVEFYAGNNVDISTYDFTGVQLEKGSQATSYSAYFTPIELCKIGVYQDYIWNDNGAWKIHKEVGKAIVDGSTGVWGKPSSNRFNVDALITGYKRSDTIALSLCNQYIALRGTNDNASFNTIAANYNYCINFGSNTAYSNLRFKNTDYDDLDVFKTALSTSPVTIYYALATPTDTEITNAALVAQLEALAAGTTYDGITNIAFTCVQGNDNGELEIEYYTQYDAMRLYDKFIWINKWEAL